MNTVFRRILALARRTGDRIIVTDPEGEEVFVLMGLDQYESILGGSTDEPGLPPAPPLESKLSVPEIPPDFSEIPIEVEDPSPLSVPSTTYPAHDPRQDSANDDGKRQPTTSSTGLTSVSVILAAPHLVETPTPPPATSEAKDEEFGEEHFYLEPIE